MCREQNVPVVFALGRRALGRACSKLVPVSVVGIFNHDGCDEKFKKLMTLTQQARSQYEDMVKSFEEEIQQHLLSARHTAETNGGDSACRPFPIAYSHLGHSRTPSACSAISFISVSDQYSSLHQPTPTQQIPADIQAEVNEIKPSPDRETLDDIDEGHIADTEDEKPLAAKTQSEESTKEQHVDDGKAKNVEDWLRQTTSNTSCSSVC